MVSEGETGVFHHASSSKQYKRSLLSVLQRLSVNLQWLHVCTGSHSSSSSGSKPPLHIQTSLLDNIPVDSVLAPLSRYYKQLGNPGSSSSLKHQLSTPRPMSFSPWRFIHSTTLKCSWFRIPDTLFFVINILKLPLSPECVLHVGQSSS
ncbi:hypothetical protein ILYODFUR_016155 [Ilyodon furcidens]|uniref:Uncharacterized protein n=1 Tax=Ilyodon furcidens TaxID=33524 RepID=A0ABV0TJ30_9TELE